MSGRFVCRNFLNPTGVGFLEYVSRGGVFSTIACKMWSRQPTPLKPGRLIANVVLHKIYKFENQMIWNNVIMVFYDVF